MVFLWFKDFKCDFNLCERIIHSAIDIAKSYEFMRKSVLWLIFVIIEQIARGAHKLNILVQ